MSNPFIVPANASVSGKCPNKSHAEMVLEFNNNDRNVSFTFTDDTEKKVKLDTVSMSIWPSGPDFPNALKGKCEVASHLGPFLDVEEGLYVFILLIVQWVIGSIPHSRPVKVFLVPASAPRLV